MGKKCKILWGEFGKVQVRLWFCLSIICITTHTAFKHVFCTSGCAGSKTTCPCFLTTTSTVHLLPTPTPPLQQRSCDNTNYSSKLRQPTLLLQLLILLLCTPTQTNPAHLSTEQPGSARLIRLRAVWRDQLVLQKKGLKELLTHLNSHPSLEHTHPGLWPVKLLLR